MGAHVPGVFRCANCGFQLHQMTLNAHDGTVTARDAPGEKCPNDGSPMWRVTYAEQLAEAHEEWGKQVERAAEAERDRDALRKENADLKAQGERQSSTIAIHHENFDQIYQRACAETGEFAEWVRSITHPEAAMR
jgi:hypothetical protein